MEKQNFVGNGGIKLPIGFRFRPTDEELVLHYLKRKVFSFPLPASVIPELEVFQTNPWDLPGDLKEKRYFFCKRKGNVHKRSGITKSGYWKAMGKEKCIVAPGSNQAAFGVKRTLVFCEGNRPRGLKTQWVMHEFRLLASHSIPNPTQKFMLEMENWVVCRVYQRKRKSKNNGTKTQVSNSNKTRNLDETSVMDIMGEDHSPPQPSSSCSSEITEVSSQKTSSDQEEISSIFVT